MNKYLITVKSSCCEKDLAQWGSILFKSTLIEGLYGIETTFKKSYLKELPFVLKVEENRTGSFDV